MFGFLPYCTKIFSEHDMEFTHGFMEAAQGFVMEYGLIGLALFSFTEAFINPIPVSPVFMFAIAGGVPAWPAFFVVVLSNLAGAVVGFLLGKHLGHPVCVRLFGEKKIQKAEKFFEKWGEMGVIIMAFTPLPYKVACWAAGIFEMRFWRFLFASFIGRFAHFFVAFGVAYFGWKAVSFLI